MPRLCGRGAAFFRNFPLHLGLPFFVRTLLTIFMWLHRVLWYGGACDSCDLFAPASRFSSFRPLSPSPNCRKAPFSTCHESPPCRQRSSRRRPGFVSPWNALPPRPLTAFSAYAPSFFRTPYVPLMQRLLHRYGRPRFPQIALVSQPVPFSETPKLFFRFFFLRVFLVAHFLNRFFLL